MEVRKRWINQWEDLFFSFWGMSKDVGRIQIKGSQIRVEFGKLHFSSLLLLVMLLLYLFFKDQFVGEINLFVQIILPFPQCVHCVLHFSHDF